MTTDWRLSAAQRDAAAKRRDLEALNAYIERLDVLRAEAVGFDGEYLQRLGAINTRLFKIGPMISSVTMQSTRFPSPANLAETERLEAERSAVERERDQAKEARTTTVSDGVKTRSFCELRPDDVAARRIAVTRARDSVAAELAALEEQLTPGQLVQTGVEAPAFTEHREQVERLRARLG